MHIPVARITRHWTMFSFNDNYSVALYGPMAHHPPVACQGSWPNKFTLLSNGAPVASVRKQIFRHVCHPVSAQPENTFLV